MKKSLLSLLFLSSFGLHAMEEAAPTAPLKNFVLISAPGSGKGTFSQYLVEKYGYIQVCLGDIFRAEIREQTELGKEIQPLVEKNIYVNEKITCQIVAKNLAKINAENKPFIIDGFPRSNLSFNFLCDHLKELYPTKPVCFLQFIASDDLCTKRITGRLVCTKCQRVYNSDSAQPKIENICDNCNTLLTMRPGDTQENAQSRLKEFHRQVEPLMLNASTNFETKTIVTERSLQELYAEYDQLVKVQ